MIGQTTTLNIEIGSACVDVEVKYIDYPAESPIPARMGGEYPGCPGQIEIIAAHALIDGQHRRLNLNTRDHRGTLESRLEEMIAGV